VVAGLVGAFAYYANDMNNTISSLNTQISSKNSQISQLNSNLTNLQNQVTSENSTISLLTSNLSNLQNQFTIQQKALNDLLNVTATVVTVDDLRLNPDAWLNKRVIVEGKLSGLVGFAPENIPPYDYILFRYNETSEASTVFVGLSWNSSNLYDLANALVIGIFSSVIGDFEFHRGGYLIEAESVILLK
jgi:uncharacterized coiled-coil protein SlyX